jgi:hypothetical protein
MTDEQLALLLRQIAARIDNLADEILSIPTVDAVGKVYAFAADLRGDAHRLTGEYKASRAMKREGERARNR